MVTDSSSVEEFVRRWEEHNSSEELRHFLEQSIPFITDEAVLRMKGRILEISYSQAPRVVRLAESLKYAAKLSQQPLHSVYALITAGNLANQEGQPQEAIRLYDLAHQQALDAGSPLEAARSYIGKVWALHNQSQYKEAIEVGEAIRPLLLAANEFQAVASVDNNLGNSYQGIAEYERALAALERGIVVLSNLTTPHSRAFAAMIKYNISLMLLDQNRYQEALLIATEATHIQQELGNTVALAACQATIGLCNIQLGHFNKALRVLDEARPVFIQNNMDGKAIMCDLNSIPCYLALNRFERVVEYAEGTRARLQAKGQNITFEMGLIHHYLGIALDHLGQHGEAMAAFEQARQIFTAIGNLVLAANPTFEQAEFHFRHGELEESEALCLQAALIYQEQHFSVNNARCSLLLGRIRLAQHRLEEALHLVNMALMAGRNAQIPLLVYQALLLQAEIAEFRGEQTHALESYCASLTAVEEMRGRMAAETRASFVEDKEVAYQGAVALSLELGDWSQALKLVERGKSRGLVELLVGELDVRIKVRAEADRPLVAELEKWRIKRNQLVSQVATTQSAALNALRATSLLEAPSESTHLSRQAEIKECEKHISLLAEQLQVRNATYAEDVVLQPPETRLATEYLEEGTVLIEYYICRGEVLAFVLDRSKVVAVRRLTTSKEINRHLSLFRLNLARVTHLLAENLEPKAKQERLKQAEDNVRALLYKLYRQLITPLTEHLEGYSHLIIVPHGVLHYLPFHALYHQPTNRYLLEEWEEISYLPSGSLLSFCYKRGQRPLAERGPCTHHNTPLTFAEAIISQ
ncbi:MAG: CHAT domain-containing protein, partial [Chloroflexota bacterium]